MFPLLLFAFASCSSFGGRLTFPCFFRQVLLHPDTFDSWPKPLIQRFGALKDKPQANRWKHKRETASCPVGVMYAQGLYILQDPPPLEVIVANLIEVARRWAEATAGEMQGTAFAGQGTCQRRQQIVVEHLAALNSMRSRSHATQNMVQHSLCTVKFLVAFRQLFAVGIWEA